MTNAPFPTGPPTNRLKKNTLYLGDNGRCICRECAGATAKASLHDISGQPLLEMCTEDIAYITGGEPMSCERGCTTVSGRIILL